MCQSLKPRQRMVFLDWCACGDVFLQHSAWLTVTYFTASYNTVRSSGISYVTCSSCVIDLGDKSHCNTHVCFAANLNTAVALVILLLLTARFDRFRFCFAGGCGYTLSCILLLLRHFRSFRFVFRLCVVFVSSWNNSVKYCVPSCLDH